MSHDQHHSESLPSGALGARISPPTPTPRVEGTPQLPPAPVSSNYKTRNTDYVDSAARSSDLPGADVIATGVAAALNRHAREQAAVNGISEQEFNAAMLRSTLAQAVTSGTMSEAAAQVAFKAAFPNVDPATLKEKS